ncbi:MAG: nucleotidyltransferase domain-containing protein [Streptococcaceae bacterium]|jgi:predicted nucleotidyltransferase|nr:nucleotidyltransferase domain-containing protein [Streptococcaceae bacterium]
MTVLTIEEIKEKIIPVAKKYGIKEVYLFGSYARGEADEDSDVDLAFNYENSNVRGILAQIRLKTELEQVLGLPVDLLTVERIHKFTRFENRLAKRFEKDKVELVAG